MRFRNLEQMLRESQNSAVRGRILFQWTLIVSFSLFIAWQAFPLRNAIERNQEMLALLKSVPTLVEHSVNTYPVNGDSDAPTAARITPIPVQASNLAKSDAATLWVLGRTALARGDWAGAADALELIETQAGENPLLYRDVAIALSNADRSKELFRLLERFPNTDPSPEMRNAVEFAFVSAIHDGTVGDGEAQQWARLINPEDLYGNLYLWRAANRVGDFKTASDLRQKLIDSAAVYPADDRLFPSYIEAIPDLVGEGLWDREKVRSVLAFWAWEGQNTAEVEQLLETMALRFPSDPDTHLYLGDFWKRIGSRARAEAEYGQALAVAPDYAAALLRLGKLAGGNPSETELATAAKAFSRYQELVPDDRLTYKYLADICRTLDEANAEDPSCRTAQQKAAAQLDAGQNSGSGPSSATFRAAWLSQLAAAQPKYLVGQAIQGNWTLLGYDVDEESLIRNEPVDLLIYWQGPPEKSPGSTEEGWYQAGGRWVQVLRGVQNLIHNGGFELGLLNGWPVDFPTGVTQGKSYAHQLVGDSRNGEYTTAVILQNSSVIKNSILISRPLPVKDGALYLQSAWIKSPDGNPYFEHCWKGYADEAQRPCYEPVVGGIVTKSWEHYVGLARPFLGANGFEVWLHNYLSEGRAYFDNVFVLEIGMPAE